MEVPKKYGEIEIHGVVFKGTLPETFRKKIKSSSFDSRLSSVCSSSHWAIRILFINTKNKDTCSMNGIKFSPSLSQHHANHCLYVKINHLSAKM
jgi:hypothetical protein